MWKKELLFLLRSTRGFTTRGELVKQVGKLEEHQAAAWVKFIRAAIEEAEAAAKSRARRGMR